MTGETDIAQLTYELLKRMQGQFSRIVAYIGDLKLWMTTLERQMGNVISHIGHLETQVAGTNRRIDRLEERVGRIERRLDLIDVPN